MRYVRRLDLSEIQETAFIRRGANFSFGQTAYPDGGGFRVTSGAYAALILLETGTMSTVIDRNRRELHAGECGIFINRTGRRSTYAPGSRVMWCETPLLKSALPEVIFWGTGFAHPSVFSRCFVRALTAA